MSIKLFSTSTFLYKLFIEWNDVYYTYYRSESDEIILFPVTWIKVRNNIFLKYLKGNWIILKPSCMVDYRVFDRKIIVLKVPNDITLFFVI